MEILKIFTYTGCSEDYWDHIMSYPSNENSVAVKGYGVDDSNPENAKRQFKTIAQYYGNERKNPFNQYIISLTRETAPDAETAAVFPPYGKTAAQSQQDSGKVQKQERSRSPAADESGDPAAVFGKQSQPDERMSSSAYPDAHSVRAL